MGFEPVTIESQSIILPIKLYSPGNTLKGTGFEPAKGYILVGLQPTAFVRSAIPPVYIPIKGLEPLRTEAPSFKLGMYTIPSNRFNT